MQKLIFSALALTFCFDCEAQLKLTLGGGNQKSIVTQYIGAHAHVTIKYNSPDVTSPQGQSRMGQVWGNLVPYGLANLNFGLSSADKPFPWRAGANENTEIKLSHDMGINGHSIAAGKYGLHNIPEESGPLTLILSYNSGA